MFLVEGGGDWCPLLLRTYTVVDFPEFDPTPNSFVLPDFDRKPKITLMCFGLTWELSGLISDMSSIKRG